MNHHTFYVCPRACANQPHCVFCDGGLRSCTVCGGAESTLPTECPGTPMNEKIQDAIVRGEIDFVGGAWTPRARTT